MKNGLFFTVIISNKNALRWLEKCLNSLKNQTLKKFEVIFIDNASTDKSVEYVHNTFSWIKIIQNKRDLGPGVAMNIAGKKANGKYLFFMNTDSYIDPTTLEDLAYFLNQSKSNDLIELNMKNYEKSNMQDPPYKFGMDIFGYPMPSKKLFYADACGMAVKKSLFDKLEGFDSKFYMYLDDLDFSWRARLVGIMPKLLENLYIYHHTGGTSIATSTHYHKKKSYTSTLSRRYHAQKNNIRALIKNYSFKMLLFVLPISIVLAIIEGWLYLFRGNLNGFIIIHKSLIWNILNIKDTLIERNKIQTIRTIEDSEIIAYCEKKIAKIHSFKTHGVPKLMT